MLGNDANAVYGYNDLGRLTDLDNNLNDTNSTVISFDYTYDVAGNRLTMTVDAADVHLYSYDSLGQVVEVNYPARVDIDYAYDKLGNRTAFDDGNSIGYTANSLNQYASVDDVNFAYDDNGNLAYDGTYSYYYDCENRLIDVNDSDGNSVAAYAYDYKGRRISSVVAGVTRKYCYAGDQVIAEYNGSDSIQVRFYYGAGIDEPVCMQKYGDDAGLYYYHYDGLGSVAALTDSTGEIVESYEYDIFGQPTIYDVNGTEIAASAYENSYLFTARRYDTETGNYYYRARYYNPRLGRFLQTDPIGYTDGMNLYTYVHNNPVMYVDPFGLYSLFDWTTIPSPFDEITEEMKKICDEYTCCECCFAGVEDYDKEKCYREAFIFSRRYYTKLNAWIRKMDEEWRKRPSWDDKAGDWRCPWTGKYIRCDHYSLALMEMNLVSGLEYFNLESVFHTEKIGIFSWGHSYVEVFHSCNDTGDADAKLDPWSFTDYYHKPRKPILE